jgi:hypothetical protein
MSHFFSARNDAHDNDRANHKANHNLSKTRKALSMVTNEYMNRKDLFAFVSFAKKKFVPIRNIRAQLVPGYFDYWMVVVDRHWYYLSS